MVYRGVCARLDGEPDLQGDILNKNIHIPRNPVNVTHDFYEKTRIGDAYIQVEGKEVVAYVRFHDNGLFSQEVVESMYVVVGGSIVERDGGNIKEWTLNQVAITPLPCDKTLTKLKLNPYNNCCEYSGPPFRPCYYCGRRKST